MKTIVRVSRDNITTNKSLPMGERGIVVTAFYADGSQKSGMGAVIRGPSRIVYDGEAVWIETDAEVVTLS